jgi:hypothetical protein
MHYRCFMNEAQAIAELGRWIASRPTGTAHLEWANGRLALGFHEGKITSAVGPDPDALAARLGTETLHGEDLIQVAQAMAERSELTEIQAVGAVKSLILGDLRSWYLDPNRAFEVGDAVAEPSSAHSISATHAIVELVLSGPGDELVDAILPDRDVLLTRTEGFLDLYAPLGLAEEADLIVAKITGQRTGGEIQTHSPHPKDEVGKLLAALVAAGMLVTREPDPPTLGVSLPQGPAPAIDVEDTPQPKPLSPLVFFVPAIVLVAAAVLVWWFFLRAEAPQPGTESTTGRWGVAVDLGCEPHEYRRLLQVARTHENVQPVAIDGAEQGGEGCWRLVWGDFPSRAAAQGAVSRVPGEIRRDGFDLHVVQIPASPDAPKLEE